MHITKIPFSDLPMLAKTDRAYSENDPLLRPFYKYETVVESFPKIIADKKKDKTDRNTLVEILRAQYKNLENFSPVQQNVEALLSENTFTITTAHQPSLLLGPLYFIYKIFSVINLCEKLNSQLVGWSAGQLVQDQDQPTNRLPDQPTKNKFVPVFVIGGEDHDFDEVNHINIFGKKLVWQKPEDDGGAVGMMETESLKPVLEELKTILGDSEQAQKLFETIHKAYTSHKLYQDATQDLLNALFGKYGLVVLNMNDKTLKRLFIPVMEREIREQVSKKLVQASQEKLEVLGFKPQAFARDINLFYMRDNSRERIIEETGIYIVVNSEKKWQNLEEIVKELHEYPERFSPNVVLRPLYQETILPNLAYVGGGGELAYWLERKTQFEHFGINFPMLIRRNSVMWLDKNSQEKMSKLGISRLVGSSVSHLVSDQLTNRLTDLLTIEELAAHPDTLTKNYIAKNAEQPLNFDEEKKELATIFDKITERAKSVDASLEKTVLAEKTKQLQSVEAIEARLIKAEKQRHETALNQVRALQQKLFPNQGLQERTDNFMPIYLKNGETFFEVLKENLNPLEQGMIVMSE